MNSAIPFSAKTVAVGVVASLLLLGLFGQTGCNVKPGEPRTSGGFWGFSGKVLRTLAVNPDDPAEVAAATVAETARINYRYRLEVLAAYYHKMGNMDKYNWALDEKDNLRTAQTFEWANLPTIEPPAGESLEDADEHLLVEYLSAARKGYINAVAELADLYQRKEPGSYKARRIENMQLRLFPERTHRYFMEAELPPEELRPNEVIPEADALYAKAMELHRRGKGFVPFFLFTSYDKQRRALIYFRQLVYRYPTSTKAALTAYYIGEISKEYFNKDVQAVYWYQRAWQWDPNIPRPARFQAAVVYDYRLQTKSKAIECYKLTIEHEQSNAFNVSFAHRRIRELTGR